ncbi:WD repeat and coiled-coil-containing protein [Protopterus annectens]|nr:WD repeat and coiled-coil-containing protein [Protopterus annectens]
MDLGKAKLLRTGLNTLRQCIHPVYGIAWTDGKQVALTGLDLRSDEPKFGVTTVIGQFEHVHGLYWSHVYSAGSSALLAVQHKKHISIWQITRVQEQNRLLVSQTCEASEPFPLLPQGCVWHPTKDVLAILTKRDASILYAVRADNCRVKVDIKGSGLIHGTCWTKDGSRLVIAIGSALHSYIWNDVQKTANACTFCPIFDVGSYICAIEATLDSQVAVATELPLDKICGLNAGIAFDVSNGTGTEMVSSNSPVLVVNEHSVGMRRRSMGSERSLSADSTSSSLSGPVDLTHILANHRKSDPSPLIHLRRRDYLTGSGQDSSRLILVTFERKVTTTKKVNIPGILVPDIITFDSRAHVVAVASNTCSTILVYCVTSSGMPNVQQIQLERNERPKGLCFLTDKILLIMVGKQRASEPAFLPSSSNSDKYFVRLMIKDIVFEDDASTMSGTSLDSGVSFPGARVSESMPQDHHMASKELLIPGSNAVVSPTGKRRLIEEIRSSGCEQSQGSHISDLPDMLHPKCATLGLEGLDAEPVNRSFILHGISSPGKIRSRPLSPRQESENFNQDSGLTKNIMPNEKSLDKLSRNLEKLCTSFVEVQQCLSDLTDFTKNGKRMSPGGYPASSEPPFVYVICQNLNSNGMAPSERRAFLLCNGRLRLSTVQEVFNLSAVEMKYGAFWIVLVADSEGFVPLMFKSKQEVFIRDGSIKQERCGDLSKKLSKLTTQEDANPIQ